VKVSGVIGDSPGTVPKRKHVTLTYNLNRDCPKGCPHFVRPLNKLLLSLIFIVNKPLTKIFLIINAFYTAINTPDFLMSSLLP